MAKAGRNEPCPCGSGKKYKQCCLAKDEESARAILAASPRQPALRSRIGDFLAGFSAEPDDELTAASNAVIELIHAGRLDDAERSAHDLVERFPEVHDGYDRLGQVYEARGNYRQAAAYYRKVIAFIREHPEMYDPDFEAVFQRLVDKLDPLPTALDDNL